MGFCVLRAQPEQLALQLFVGTCGIKLPGRWLAQGEVRTQVRCALTLDLVRAARHVSEVPIRISDTWDARSAVNLWTERTVEICCCHVRKQVFAL